jgi:hypothetical protein
MLAFYLVLSLAINLLQGIRILSLQSYVQELLARGELLPIQFDRTAEISLGYINIYFGTTREDDPSFGPTWNVTRLNH